MNKDKDLKKATLTEELVRKLEALNELAGERGQTLAEMALSWTLKDGDVASAIIGASRPAQIVADAKLNTAFTAEELARIDEITL